jgi:hypothetical protein
MENYDFSALTPEEFEKITRDLLKLSLDIDFETFKTGRDGGIDLRHIDESGQQTIVQCKRYSKSSVSNLISNLRNEELPKIEKLKPARYILVTALGLSPQNKEEILKILSPYTTTPSDIVDREQLNDWLRDFPQIERNYFNLWACSSNIIERILHSGIYNYTEAQLPLLQERLRYCVKSAAFEQATTKLNENRVCIIAGAPGIGKTTLAEMLLIQNIDEFIPIKISSDINEAFEVFNPTQNQFFYYDDFLGQTGVDTKLNKNEDQRILEFCAMITKSKNSLLVLTTREYILNQARKTYERLAKADIDPMKCVIDIDSYKQIDRAKILYNHLYHKEVDRQYIEKILEDKSYLKIINHPSFNPRIIETVTSPTYLLTIQPEDFVEQIKNSLNNPQIIWEHAFNEQIHDASRHLLLTLLAIPGSQPLDYCENIFRQLRERLSRMYTLDRSHRDFHNALKESEGAFVKVGLNINGERSVGYLNPSIRDYVSNYYADKPEFVIELIKTCSTAESLQTIWNSFNGNSRVTFDTKSILNAFSSQLSSALTHFPEEESHSQLVRICEFSMTVSNEKFYAAKLLAPSLETTFEKLFNMKQNLSLYKWDRCWEILNQVLNEEHFNANSKRYLKDFVDAIIEHACQISHFRLAANIQDQNVLANEIIGERLEHILETVLEIFPDEFSYIKQVEDYQDAEQLKSDLEQIDQSVGSSCFSDEIDEIDDYINQIYDYETGNKKNIPIEKKLARLKEALKKPSPTHEIDSLFKTVFKP